MKTQHTLLTAACCGLLLATISCGKQEPTPPPAPTPQGTNAPTTGAIQKAVDTAQGQTAVVQEKIAETKTQVDAATSKVQSLIDQARKLGSENKWSEALALLGQLSGQTLSTEQQSLVQGLKDEAGKAAEASAKAKATDEAAKAAGGLLQPKK